MDRLASRTFFLLGYLIRTVSARREPRQLALHQPLTQRFQTRGWVPFAVELAFAFFANPANLPHLMPARLKARSEDARLKPPPWPVSADPARRFLSVAAGLVKRQLARSFTHRQKRLPEILAIASRQAARRG